MSGDVHRDGTVTQVTPLRVAIGSSTVGVPVGVNANYSPAIGDRVKVCMSPGDPWVVCKIRPPA